MTARLQPLRLKKDEPLNHSHPLPGISFDDVFVLLGEVGDSQHFILARYAAAAGRKGVGIMPGMYELYRFETIPTDEL